MTYMYIIKQCLHYGSKFSVRYIKGVPNTASPSDVHLMQWTYPHMNKKNNLYDWEFNEV